MRFYNILLVVLQSARCRKFQLESNLHQTCTYTSRLVSNYVPSLILLDN
jgi:hypothetical protein